MNNSYVTTSATTLIELTSAIIPDSVNHTPPTLWIIPSLLFQLLQLTSHVFSRRLRMNVFLRHISALCNRWLQFHGQLAIVSLSTRSPQPQLSLSLTHDQSIDSIDRSADHW